MSQEILLRIVKTWDLSEKPEYRGFRCASCQSYMHKAWHHWLTGEGYRTPVHFCNKCESDYRSSGIRVTKPGIDVDRNEFGLRFPGIIEAKLIEIVGKWDTDAGPVYKTFTCDDCGINMHKAYHVWFNMDKTLVEVHFCKKCGDKLSLHELS